MAMRWISPIIEGEIYENSNGSKVEVTFVESARKVHFKCLDNYGYNGVCTAEHLKSGVFSNPYDKTLCGVGYLGVGIHKTRTNGTKNEAHIKWHSMINRCYGPKVTVAYKDVKVCEEWHNFQNFADWWQEHDPGILGWHLDKDILSGFDCKIYSPTTCCIIPKELNSKLIRFVELIGTTGIYQRSGTFYVRVGGKGFKSFKEAKTFYLNKKQNVIEEVLNFYGSKLDFRILPAVNNIFKVAYKEIETSKEVR